MVHEHRQQWVWDLLVAQGLLTVMLELVGDRVDVLGRLVVGLRLLLLHGLRQIGLYSRCKEP